MKSIPPRASFHQFRHCRFTLLALTLVAFFVPSRAAAQEIAELYSAEGSIEGQVTPARTWGPIERGQKFLEKDAVRTLEKSRAGVRFSTGYLVRMNEKTTITFEKPAGQSSRSRLSVLEGIGHFFSRTSSEFPNVNTPHVSASVRGTEFVVAVSPDVSVISVLDGLVDAENQFGSVSLTKGEQAIVRAGAAPVKQILVRPNDAVQWALYYPAVLNVSDLADFEQTASSTEQNGIRALREGDFAAARAAFSGGTWQSAVGRAILRYREGDATGALSELRSYRGDRSASMSLLESSLLLSLGQVEESVVALRESEGQIATQPKARRARLNALLLSQRAVVELVRGKRNDAEGLASEALKLAPDSAAARLALSFVRQSELRLDEARSMLEAAAAAEPDNGVVAARYAEILLGFGEREKAREVAEAALEKDPQNAYVLAVLGFIELTRYEADRAEKYFTDAAKADSGFALPLLGLGLAQIREGRLEEGRGQLEKAVLLDPAVSLYRSYLGKSYFEEEREGMSLHEYARAMELDPLDPTPHLYQAYSLLSEHRPVEALDSLQRSIQRNENRAVFRSRLLLDQDEGTRSTGLGQIYSRLGFSEIARVEAIRALSRDYSNYSAHFLLADLYRDTHLNSRAQVTENLIGRLLSPVTFNANDVDLGGEASLNEYSTLFNRPAERANLQAYGRSQTEAGGGRATYTSTTERLGLTVGYAGSYRDGFRENDWLRTHQLFTLGQYALSADDTLVWDGALTANDQGDIVVDTDPFAEDPDFESKFDGGLARVGYHRRLGPGTHLITQVFYNAGDFDGRDNLSSRRLTFLEVTDNGAPVTPSPFVFDGRTDESTTVEQRLGRADVQLLHDTDLVSFVLGTSAGVERLEGDEEGRIVDTGSSSVLGFLQGRPLSSSSSLTETSSQTFAYTTWHLLPWVDLDAGLTYSWLEFADNTFDPPFADARYNKDQLGPKAGLVIDLTPESSLRFAYSKTLDRTGRGGLGPLEPTFVGGFNQVYDGVRGSGAELYGAGLDFHLGSKTYAGIGYQRRELDLDVPFITGGLTIERNGLGTTEITSEQTLTGGATVDRVTTYLYQTVGTSTALILDYNFERFDEDDPFPESETNRVGTRAQYFLANGLFAFGGATYRYQELAGLQDPKSTTDFWILDAGIGYELDHRHGAVLLRFDNLLDEEFRYAAIADEDPVLPRFGAELSMQLSF